MHLVDQLLAGLPDGEVEEVRIGLHWTAVVVEAHGEPRCGLASTVAGGHEHGTEDVPQAGDLQACSGLELAALIRRDEPALRSVGVAALNALLPRQPDDWVDRNAGEVIAQHGANKEVVLVGHFPFIPRLRERVGRLHVLEQDPGPDELPAGAAEDVMPRADVAAITSMTLINQTLEDLLGLCRPDARVILLGPSTPLSPVLFDHGVDLLCGSIVTGIEPVLRTVGQGGVFRQVHKAGVRLVAVERPDLGPSQS